MNEETSQTRQKTVGRFTVVEPTHRTKEVGRFTVTEPIENSDNSTTQNKAPTTRNSRFEVTTVHTPRMNVGTTSPRLLETSGAAVSAPQTKYLSTYETRRIRRLYT